MQTLKEHRPLQFAIIGAGNGGQTMAGHLALMGYPVNLYGRNPHKIDRIKQHQGIHLRGQIKGFGRLNLATTNIREAIIEADIIMVVVPANAHKSIAKACAPYLHEGQIVILNPGRTGGALEFRKHINCNVTVAETQTLLYACRTLKPGFCQVYGIKHSVPIAAFPGYNTSHVISLIKAALPQFVPCKNVLVTSLGNIGAVFHPTITLLNATRIENNETFDFYTDGVTRAVASFLESVDYERVAIATALSVKVASAKKWLNTSYGSFGQDLYTTIHNTPSYKGIPAPSTLNTRYIYEDVPTGLVPLASIGKQLGLKTPSIDTLINLASIISNQDFMKIGRNAYDMGFESMDINLLENYVMNGGDRDEKETA